MIIRNQRLLYDDGTPIRFQPSPNFSSEKLKQEFIIIHYTEGQSLEGTVTWLTNKDSGVSCHLVIGRDGTVVLLVPFDRQAWHAGNSEWKERKRLNRYSIGIELDNAGLLKKTPQGWQASFKRVYPDEEVLVAVHKIGSEVYGWHIFPPKQIDSCVDVCAALVKEYGIQEIVGHDDIAPKRKWDPGPAFPMDELRQRVADRLDEKPHD
jgi:N-acetylmuramoyl-L-alanine amidase